MFIQTVTENLFNLFSNLINCKDSFFTGFASGVAANWVCYKYRSRKKEPHLELKTDSGDTHFSGIMNSYNKDQVINTLRSSVSSTSKNKNYEATRTDIAPFHGRDSSKL